MPDLFNQLNNLASSENKANQIMPISQFCTDTAEDSKLIRMLLNILVPKAGIEPARAQSPVDFESTASTNSATSARCKNTFAKGVWLSIKKGQSSYLIT